MAVCVTFLLKILNAVWKIPTLDPCLYSTSKQAGQLDVPRMTTALDLHAPALLVPLLHPCYNEPCIVYRTGKLHPPFFRRGHNQRPRLHGPHILVTCQRPGNVTTQLHVPCGSSNILAIGWRTGGEGDAGPAK